MYLEIYNFIAQNKWMFRLLYSIAIVLICLVIVIKTNRLFKLSQHQGIRYFRNAFFFYGIAFVLRYLLVKSSYFNLMRIIFEFFIVMAGFFLLYSLIWKKLEGDEKNASSLFNIRIFVFYILALIIAVLDYLWVDYTFMLSSQILLFFIASIISYINYKKSEKKSFLGSYFAAMVLSFIAWSLNFIFSILLSERLRWLANVYALNVIVFLILLYGVIKTTKKKNG